MVGYTQINVKTNVKEIAIKLAKENNISIAKLIEILILNANELSK